MRRSRAMGLIGLALGLSGCAGTSQCRISGPTIPGSGLPSVVGAPGCLPCQRQVQAAQAAGSPPDSPKVGRRVVAANAPPLGIPRYLPTFEEQGEVVVSPWEIARPDPLGVRTAATAQVPAPDRPQAEVRHQVAARAPATPPDRPKAAIRQVAARAPEEMPVALNVPVPSRNASPPVVGARAAGSNEAPDLPDLGLGLGDVLPPEVERLVASEQPVPVPSTSVPRPASASSAPVAPMEPAPSAFDSPPVPVPSAPMAPREPAPDVTSMIERGKGKPPAKVITLDYESDPVLAGRPRWPASAGRPRQSPHAAGSKSDHALVAAFHETPPGERLVPIPREESSPRQRVSLLARLYGRIRGKDGEDASTRGEADDVAQRGQGTERVAADGLDKPSKR